MRDYKKELEKVRKDNKELREIEKSSYIEINELRDENAIYKNVNNELKNEIDELIISLHRSHVRNDKLRDELIELKKPWGMKE